MQSFLLIAAGLLVAATAVVAVLALRRPDRFRVERSITIQADASRIFPLINDLRALNTWNPFNADPRMTGTYDGPPAGPGASYTFDGGRAGSGRLEVTGGEAPSRVDMRLVMTRPLACDNQIVFGLAPDGRATRVTWAMSGPSTFAGKVMDVLIGCDRMCGAQFEKGLADLKAKAEAKPLQAAAE